MAQILNLGCNDKLMPGIINVDIQDLEGVSAVVDLSVYPWMWEDNSVDGIYARHIIEHFQDPVKFINECKRILKPGGFLDIYVPHSSSIGSVGMIEHYRTFCYNGLNNALIGFQTTYHKLSWWYGSTNWINLPYWKYVLLPINFILNFFINLSPCLFENLWWVYVGGAREVQWRGIKC